MDEYKSVVKYLNKEKDTKKNKTITKVLNKIFISVIILLISLCFIKTNSNFKDWIYKNVYQTNFSFTKINNIYEKYFGNVFPITNTTVTQVFDEKLTYSSLEEYKEGVKLTVGNSYLVPILESGIVVYIGNKDNYGNTIIVQQVNGIDLWYVGVDSNVKIYDYVEKGSLLGESSSNEIYLYYQKDGEFVSYKEYFG